MLSKKTKYGLKALTFLAHQEMSKPIQIAELPTLYVTGKVFYSDQFCSGSKRFVDITIHGNKSGGFTSGTFSASYDTNDGKPDFRLHVDHGDEKIADSGYDKILKSAN